MGRRRGRPVRPRARGDRGGRRRRAVGERAGRRLRGPRAARRDRRGRRPRRRPSSSPRPRRRSSAGRSGPRASSRSSSASRRSRRPRSTAAARGSPRRAAWRATSSSAACPARVGAAGAMRGLGQRGHSWGNPDWEKIALTRAVGAWFEDGTGALVQSVRPAKADNHADEAIWAAMLDAERTLSVEDPRLSTTTDEAGRQIRAGSSCGSARTTTTRCAASARCWPARRSSSAPCASTSRSSAGTSRAAPRSAATTSCGARDQGRRLGLRRRRHAAADRGLQARRTQELGHPARGTSAGRWRSPPTRAPEPPLWTLERGQLSEPEFIDGPASGAVARCSAAVSTSTATARA